MSVEPWIFYPAAGAMIILGVYIVAAVILAVIVAVREAFTRPYR
jgi:hypothetical protein